MTTASILLVDDDVEVLKALTKVLQKDGCEVVAERDAVSAVRLVESTGKHFDLVITDVTKDGTDSAALVKSFQRVLPSAPILAITEFGETEQHSAALRERAFEALNKPLEKMAFLAAVHRGLTQSCATATRAS